MFGLLAVLSSLMKPRNEREALNYENYIRSGQGFPSTRIYRESSEEKRKRKELAAQRSYQRVEQQIKLIRLMKKLLQQTEQYDRQGEIDSDFERMRHKVAELQEKIERIAQEKNFIGTELFDLEKNKQFDDVELEQFILNASMKMEDDEPKSKSFDYNHQSGDDHLIHRTSEIDMSSPSEHGDYPLGDFARKRC